MRMCKDPYAYMLIIEVKMSFIFVSDVTSRLITFSIL
jgi:hypothetical protein